jgi:hypothetical protein
MIREACLVATLEALVRHQKDPENTPTLPNTSGVAPGEIERRESPERCPDDGVPSRRAFDPIAGPDRRDQFFNHEALVLPGLRPQPLGVGGSRGAVFLEPGLGGVDGDHDQRSNGLHPVQAVQGRQEPHRFEVLPVVHEQHRVSSPVVAISRRQNHPDHPASIQEPAGEPGDGIDSRPGLSE